jgi:iron complex outermembrane receptor protein
MVRSQGKFIGTLAAGFALAGFAALVPVAGAQQQTGQSATLPSEEVVVTGTRKLGKSATETLSPVDLIAGNAITDQGAFDLTDSLTQITPSLSTLRYPIADGTALIRPVSLRNLSPDQTLVLINGSRRHRSALVNLQIAPVGTVNQGSQAVDWAAFPAAAIKRVEILRDGASAQYGSDAIAGVINVLLKDARDGGSLTAQYGRYSERDGDRLSISGNVGLPLTDNGFLNLTGEHSKSQKTWRGQPRPDAAAVGAIVGANLVPLRGLGQRWGDPEVKADKFLLNSGITLSDKADFYGTGTYSYDKTVSDFFYRRPVLANPADQIALSARTTLQIDNNNDGLPDPAPQSLVNSITSQGLHPSDYLVPSASSPSGYVLRNPIYTKFPGGYNPSFGADLTDFEGIVGLRGRVTDTLRWDGHVRYGEDKVEYRLDGSINPSLGGLSPTSFRPGTLTQDETGVNLDFVKTFTGSPLNVAFGAEWRDETYKVGAGDLPSIEAGPTAAVFGVGSDGFQGFPVESAGDFKSDSVAGYVDVETNLTDQLSGAVAIRDEHYQKFGNTFNWKVSARYAFTDTFAVRATANTGFRAPTPGQVNTLNVTTTADSSGNLIPNGTYPVSNPIAMALGSVPLVPEKSRNYTGGLVWSPTRKASATLDYYHIRIDHRLAFQNNTIGPAEVARLTAAGIPNANLLLGSNANFFTNAFDSTINGVDLATTGSFAVVGGDLTIDLRHNYNEQKISNIRPGTINASRVYDLEHQVPKNKSTLTFDYAHADLFSGVVRFSYYGDWSSTGGLFSPGDASDAHSYNGKILIDLEARYTYDRRYTFTIGGENIFNTYPGLEQDPTLQFLGVKRSVTSPFGFNGAFWYARAAAKF